MKRLLAGVVFALTATLLAAQTAHAPLGIVSDWTQHHVLYPETKDASASARIQNDPRRVQSWYLHHSEVWWPEHRRKHHHHRHAHRDWSVPLLATPPPGELASGFEPLFDFTFSITPDAGYASLNTTDLGEGLFMATAGNLNVTSGAVAGSYTLYPLVYPFQIPAPPTPGYDNSPTGFFVVNNVLYPSTDPSIDLYGILFTGGGIEVNFWGNGPDNYTFDNNLNGTQDIGAPFTLNVDPGGGQTAPAKFVFDLTAAPSCTNDYVAIGIPANAVPGAQANIVGVNNLYGGGAGAFCPSGPTVMFAYASGSGEVPASLVLSQDGTQLAYIENLTTGSSYFHVLTIGTTGLNGSSATAPAVPGTGNNAVDQAVLLTPDGGITNQSSTNTVFVAYTSGDTNDVAFATTYSSAGSGSGYLYKIGNVFNGAPPAILWSVPINAVPSTPVYDTVSNNVFFTDSNGRIDYVANTNSSPSVVYGPVLASGATGENPVIVDSGNQMVYATFNSNGTNALIVQTPTSLASAVSTPVGTGNTTFTGPYEPDFNHAWYTGSGTPLLYIAGTGTGTLPTLYSIGFNASGIMNSTADPTTAALATGVADSSSVTEFYNANLQKDFLFVGVTDHCVATVAGGTAGCVMSLDLTSGFPTVNANTAALAAAGGTSGIVIDNDSAVNGASSVYYVTKTGGTLVKATQSGLN